MSEKISAYRVHFLASSALILIICIGLITLTGNTTMHSDQQTSAAHPFANAKQISARVNIAGRQRMLTQRAVLVACLSASGIDTGRYHTQSQKVREMFARALRQLRDGSSLLDLPPETDGQILVALLKIEPEWVQFDQRLSELDARGAVTADDLLTLNDAAEGLLQSSDTVTFRIAQTYKTAAPDLPFAKTVVVDLAGRQRMLSQRAVKNTCLIRQAADPKRFRDDLNETVRLFDATLTALRDGDAQLNIPRATHPDVTEQLAITAKYWPAVKRVLDDVAAGGTLSDDALAALARRTETLLEALDRTAKAYETASRL